MSIPIRTFWFMSDCIERVSAQEDQRKFRVANNASQGADAQEYVEQLSKSVGKVYVVDEAAIAQIAPRDEGGFEDLRMMATQSIGK